MDDYEGREHSPERVFLKGRRTMFESRGLRPWLSIAAALFLVSGLIGCAGYPKELTDADAAIAAARAAGKDKQCPAEYNAAAKLNKDAHDICNHCYRSEAVAKANEAIRMANALCPKKEVAAEVETRPAPPKPAPPTAPMPTVSISASPASVAEGQCATVTWSSANATSVTIDPGAIRADPEGSRQVCPDRTTEYRITAVGAGGSRDASTTVTVNPRVVDRVSLHINFDFNKATLRKAEDADLQKAVAFVKKYSGYKVSLEGYTDNIGSDAYNLKLSERRAAAVKDYLVAHGADSSRIQSSGHGKANPVADNSTEKGRFENRRVEVLILSE
jgi:OOP family OmpA-OmpF porin